MTEDIIVSEPENQQAQHPQTPDQVPQPAQATSPKSRVAELRARKKAQDAASAKQAPNPASKPQAKPAGLAAAKPQVKTAPARGTAVAPKPAAKAGQPKASQKPAPKASPKADQGAASDAGRRKKDGLRAPQVRALQYLATCKEPVGRSEICEKAPVVVGIITYVMGSDKEEIRRKNDDEQMTSLVTLGYVTPIKADGKGTTYKITAEGRAALKAHEANRPKA